MPFNRYSSAVHAYTLMKEMKPGECFDIPTNTLNDMSVPLEHPLDRPDARYKIDRLQRWLPFETEVMVYADGSKVTFCRPTDAAGQALLEPRYRNSDNGTTS